MRYKILHVGMTASAFTRLADSEPTEDSKVDMELGANQVEERVLLVHLGVSVDRFKGARGSVAYLGAFELDVSDEEVADEKQFQFFAAKVSPTILYPYIRETFSTLAQRADIADVHLPILNFAEVFDADTVDLTGEELSKPAD